MSLSLLILFGTRALAATEPCETSLILSEFSKAPQSGSGLVTDSLPMNFQTLTAAYGHGLFPWALTEEGTAKWYSPERRGILDFAKLEISRSDMKFIRKHLGGAEYQVTFDQAFESVMRECAMQTRAEGATWIKPDFIKAYTDLHQAGFAHSVEVWANGELVGGLYGVFVNGVFAGESMFHKLPNVSKLTLYALIERLKTRGHTFMDVQQAELPEPGNPDQSVSLAVKWGAREVPRSEFLSRLKAAQRLNLEF